MFAFESVGGAGATTRQVLGTLHHTSTASFIGRSNRSPVRPHDGRETVRLVAAVGFDPRRPWPLNYEEALRGAAARTGKICNIWYRRQKATRETKSLAFVQALTSLLLWSTSAFIHFASSHIVLTTHHHWCCLKAQNHADVFLLYFHKTIIPSFLSEK